MVLYGISPTQQTVKSITSPVDDKIYGTRFPVGKGGVLFKKSSRKELLLGQIKQLMFTSPGERVFLPNFGVDLRSYVFEQLDDSLIQSLQSDIANQIRMYIPNCSVLSVDVRVDDSISSGVPTIIIYLTVKEKDTNEIIPLELTS